MKDYKKILAANDPLEIKTEDGSVTFMVTGNSYFGRAASQIWSEAQKNKLKQHEILQLMDEQGYVKDFCQKCFKPVHEHEELCRDCRTEETFNEMED